ncbi:MAG: hypothetical protein M1832_001382 [Thelocarpon impressellum]|nr:MAG: hypothetical protein M1832_001382 [Thelocarpon impressellum]
MPSDFRIVEASHRRPGGFRPLELSIYLPENRLSPLPTFCSDDEDDAGMDYPAPALRLPRTTSILSIPSSTFSIPRKPVGSSISLSLAGSRQSVDTRSTPASVGSEWTAESLRPRPSLPDMLDCETTIPVPAAHSRSRTEPVQIVQRRDSAHLATRMRRSLEQRREAERCLTPFDTIMEERRSASYDGYIGVLPDAPGHATNPSSVAYARRDVSFEETTPSTVTRTRSSTFSGTSCDLNRPLPPTPLFESPASMSEPQLQASPDVGVALSHQRSFSRVSKWLFPGNIAQPEVPSASASLQKAFYQCASARRAATASTAGSIASSLSTLDDLPSPPTMSPHSSPGGPTRQRTFGHMEAHRRRKGGDVLPLYQAFPTYHDDEELSVSSVGAGITNCFVNLGSDHPSILEAIVKGQREKKGAFPNIITCPNEMVALSMADGYARLTGKPQCVIVHVDVGTQGLGAAVHNASCGRAPVLIFAGLSPYTLEGEMRGSRTEYIHWIQDVPDQKLIVGQYCRYAAEIKTGRNVKQMVNRALQFATSDPQGPVYLVGAREVMEQELEPYQLTQKHWNPIGVGVLPESAVAEIATALVEAKQPLLITGYSGRKHAAVAELVKLADTVKGLQVGDSGGSDMCFPADHPAWRGLRYGTDEALKTADVILVVDCDVPWVNTLAHPHEDAVVYHVDVDPLKQQMPVFYLAAVARYRADSCETYRQLHTYIRNDKTLSERLSGSEFSERADRLVAAHAKRVEIIAVLAKPADDGSFGTACLSATLRRLLPRDTIFAIEAVTNTTYVADQLQPTLPGTWINCGGGGLGWSGGAALGMKLATMQRDGGAGRFVCAIVGDGTFLFSVPGSVFWIAQRYKLPLLTIVLNNNAGYVSSATNEELNISFAPTPDYAGLAKAAAGGNLWAGKATTMDELERLLPEAIRAVEGGVGAVLDACIAGP